MLYGAIEAGGTKFVCAIVDEAGCVHSEVSLPTRDPELTLADVAHFFREFSLTSISIGSFGPIELDLHKANYGEILNSPKMLWKNFNIYRALKTLFNIPIFLDTDVNMAALGEYYWGAAKNKDSCLYITVGTGIGAGFVQRGETFKGRSHPEMGHIFVPRHNSDLFGGSCPYHQDCLEGLASGSAIEARYGKKGNELQDNGEVWDLEAYYMAKAIVNYSLILAPEIIILGGGVLKQSTLIPLIRSNVNKMLNKYISINCMEEYIVSPQLNDKQAILGALALGTK
ncbi:ROK family protein [Alkalihalobacillus sp. 1P02AB]|uniref:ROK family protein n=1 Tax=Alkalihalobacillus sp. 1P02AB TaxID=3132260 RepID=UPI0039A6F798